MAFDRSAGQAQERDGQPFRMGGIGKHALIYAIGILLGKAVSFVMLPIYTRYLDPANYGTMQLIQMTLDVIAIIAGTQLATGIFRYYSEAQSGRDRSAVVSTAFVLLSANYGAVGLATFLAAPWISELVFATAEHAGLIRLAAASLACNSFILVPLTFFRVRAQSHLYVMAQLAMLVLQVTLNLLFLVHFEMGVRSIFLSNLIAVFSVGLILTIYLISQVGIHFSRSATRSLMRYGIPLIATQLATFLLAFGDRYFLQAATDSSVVGVYALAYEFGFLLAVVGYLPFGLIWEPARFEIAKRVDRDEVFSRGFIYLNVLQITVAVIIALFIDDVLRIMTTPPFYPAAAFVPIILIAYVLQGWAMFQDIGMHVRKRTEFITAANWLAAAVAMVGYAILIPRYLGMGAAWATVAAFLVRYLGLYLTSQTIWPVRYQWRPVCWIVGLGVAAVTAGMALPTVDWWISLLIKASILVAYLGGLVVTRVVPPAELRKGMAWIAATRRLHSPAA
jgi:O-antigen/teichoic acid export membrane protein